MQGVGGVRRFALGWLRQHVCGISPAEATVARRRFRVGSVAVRRRLEGIGHAFLHGYHTALLDDAPETLAHRLTEVERELHGFAFEGAGMGLALLDQLWPWRQRRLIAFLHGAGGPHTYLVHVGAGWALALLRRRVEPLLVRLDPVLRWLVVDGYGFYHGYFHWPRYIAGQAPPPGRLLGYSCRAFDQGLGRSLWFVDGADVARIPATLAAFPPVRHADLWSGVGLACAYAGGVNQADLTALRHAAGPYHPHLAQGVVFAARARQRAGNPASHTELACLVLCGMSADAAAHIAEVTLQGLPDDAQVPAYEIWRRRTQAYFAEERVIA
jgi:hypothetical protein